MTTNTATLRIKLEPASKLDGAMKVSSQGDAM